MDKEGSPHRKVYARGYFDGLRAAGVETDGLEIERKWMTPAKFDAMYRDQSAMAKKVYEAIPIENPWTAAQIHRELLRLHGSFSDMHITAGCINSLIRSKLVTEPKQGHFIRVPVKPKTENVVSIDSALTMAFQKAGEKMEQKAQVVVGSKDPIDRLTALSKRARQVSSELTSLAADIDNAALEISEQMSSTDADAAKLKQLQQLLKSLG